MLQRNGLLKFVCFNYTRMSTVYAKDLVSHSWHMITYSFNSEALFKYRVNRIKTGVFAIWLAALIAVGGGCGKLKMSARLQILLNRFWSLFAWRHVIPVVAVYKLPIFTPPSHPPLIQLVPVSSTCKGTALRRLLSTNPSLLPTNHSRRGEELGNTVSCLIQPVGWMECTRPSLPLVHWEMSATWVLCTLVWFTV